ncbi:MAG: hypothetical protein DRP37_00740 [Thermodesulfobacteriota bacterium]|nr:MAG: hypothetical protein DRP37_00740 [Thermodesulfobacteriota bacterium]
MTASPIQLVDLINIRGFDPNLFSMLKDVPVFCSLICLNANVYSIEIKKTASFIHQFTLFFEKACIIKLNADVETGNSKMEM